MVRVWGCLAATSVAPAVAGGAARAHAMQGPLSALLRAADPAETHDTDKLHNGHNGITPVLVFSDEGYYQTSITLLIPLISCQVSVAEKVV